MATVPEFVQAWKKDQLSSAQLMRLLVAHPTWSLPISEAAVAEMLTTNQAGAIQFNRDENGRNRLLLFSSNDTYNLYAKAAGVSHEQHFLTTTGTWVFSLPLDDIDEILMDPLTTDYFSYKKAYYPTLKEIAGALPLDEDLRRLRAETAAPGTVARVRDYANYFIAVATGASGQASIVMAPDDQGRTLAAIFTASDAYDAFLPTAEAKSPGAEVRGALVTGQTLFDALARMNITGMVFNCMGPATPVAFAIGFAKVILESQ
jgi:hypothetical protein